MRRAVAWIALLFASAPVFAGTWTDLWLTPDQQGQRLLDAGDASSAAKQFQDPRRRAYADVRAGNYDSAANQLAPLKDVDSLYNRGNALARAGKLKDALAAYDAALAQAPDNRDARHNRDLVNQQLQKQNGGQQSGQGGKGQPGGSGKQGGEQSGGGQQAGQQQQGQQQSGSQQGGGQQQQGNQANQQQGGGQQQQGSQANQQQGGGQQQQGSQANQQQGGGQQQQGSQANQQQGGGQQGSQAAQQQGASQQQQGSQANQPQRAGQPGSQGAQGSAQSQPNDRNSAQGQSLQNGSANDHARDLAAAGRETDQQRAAAARRDAELALQPGKVPQGRVAGTEDQKPTSEQALAREQWLRRIPEDPGELLRRKFMVEHMKKQQDSRQ